MLGKTTNAFRLSHSRLPYGQARDGPAIRVAWVDGLHLVQNRLCYCCRRPEIDSDDRRRRILLGLTVSLFSTCCTSSCTRCTSTSRILDLKVESDSESARGA